MAEADFERRLERLFAEAPELTDAQAFAERVERRMNTGWTARRWLIGAAGVAGGVIGASQLIMSDLFQRVESAGDSARVIRAGFTEVAPKAEWLSGFASGGMVVWVASGLAIIAMGFALTRVIEEL
ncbi:MAG: hypothetical protein E7812_16575 [Phenylobacterium sp.]|nr:MAG: hypothetical protein E7812_16575 [Phenylobacterium sp.]